MRTKFLKIILFISCVLIWLNFLRLDFFENKKPLARNNQVTEPIDFYQTRKIDFDEQDIMAMINAERKKKGLPALIENPKLVYSAKEKARQLIEQDYFQHVSPQGEALSDILDEIGYHYKLATENLGQGFYSVDALVGSWMNSDPHRNNILSTQVNETGVAIYRGLDGAGKDRIVFVQHFARQIEPEENSQLKICSLESKENCQKLKAENSKVTKEIEKVENLIDKARDQGAKESYLADLIEYFDELNEVDDRQEVKLKQCEEYEVSCERWE